MQQTDARCSPRCRRVAQRIAPALAPALAPPARMPMPSADWYFDFVSPFAYLQSEQLPTLAPRLAVRYRPVLFAGLLEAAGQKGPAEIATKRAFTYRFVVWQAKRLGIPLKFPPAHPFNPLPFLRLALACDGATAACPIFRSSGPNSPTSSAFVTARR